MIGYALHPLPCMYFYLYTHTFVFFTRVNQLIDKSCGLLKVSDLRRLTENKPGSLLPELIGTGESDASEHCWKGFEALNPEMIWNW